MRPQPRDFRVALAGLGEGSVPPHAALREAAPAPLPTRAICALHTWFGLLVGSGEGVVVIEEFEEMERLAESGELRTPVQDRVRAWREADREEGRAEGRAEGVEQERALLLRQTERKFGADAAERAAPPLAGIGEPERLADVGEWIIDCASGDELIARLEAAA